MEAHMTRHTPRAAATSIATLWLSALVLSATPASAEYRAWFSAWDYVGDFQPGDVSEGFSEMSPPAEACGLRITDPSYYAWTNDVDAVIASHDLYQDVIIWIDNPGADCPRSFSVTKADLSTTYSPPNGGAASMEIHTNYGAYWVNKNGYYLYTCGNCVGPDEFTVPAEDIWSLMTVSAFANAGGAILDPRRQSRALTAVAALSPRVAQLQTFLKNRITNRRRTALPGQEASVRSLEDAATRALATARKKTNSCASLVQSGLYADAFAACVDASREVEHGDALMRAAWFLYNPPLLEPRNAY
jgi:hypothetical protein